MPADNRTGTVRAASGIVLPEIPQVSLDTAAEIAATSGRRKDTPVRTTFVRDQSGKGIAPLARLVSTGGRGGAVAVKLYLALLWRLAAEPFDTSIPARKWAELLGLPDPTTRGARRIHDALRILEADKLVRITTQPGESSKIQLLEESGRGTAYTLPSTAFQRAPKDKEVEHYYFKVPTALWTVGHIQSMSAPALAMLLICLSNNKASEGKKIWWSTKIFPEQYGLSPATRARGTKELQDRGLLSVTKQLVTDSPHSSRTFTRERVRNIYQLINDATTPERAPKDTPSAPATSTPPLRRKPAKAAVAARKATLKRKT